MLKQYNIQLSNVMPNELNLSEWLEKFEVRLLNISVSENNILIECEEKKLASFLESLDFAKCK